MHELSIALSMVEQIAEELEKQGGGTVQAVYVKIGVLSGVDGQALRLAYEMACEQTELRGSTLHVELIPLLVYCPNCTSTRSPAPDEVFCPKCVTVAQEILQGRELEVSALEIAA